VRVDHILSRVPPSIEEGDQGTKNGWVVSKDGVRVFPAQDVPGSPGLHQISHWCLKQFAVLPVIDIVHCSTQTLRQEIVAAIVTVTYPGNERDFHGITPLHQPADAAEHDGFLQAIDSTRFLEPSQPGLQLHAERDHVKLDEPGG